MHLLNALPQRLDPGATPTFAGLISATLTSPASTPLTLGTGSFGTALTVASATGGATFAGAVTAPNLTLNSTGSKIEANTAGTTQKFLQFSSNGAGVYFGIESSAGDTFFTGSAAYDSVIYTPNNPLFISTTTLKLKGAQTISATTAGSSGAGALIVQGGISAGNTGAASYFGGAVTATAGTFSGYITGGANSDTLRTGSQIYISNNEQVGLRVGTDNAFNLDTYNGGSNLNALKILQNGTATFAGAVTIGGNVGFYNASPVAKPTGVAVTAAAIHAALVTLNLIAA